ncbi:vegetative incompatibility protein HET-E-1, partial [Pyrenophora tritici-repentis]
MPKPLADLIIPKADEGDVEGYQQNEVPPTPITPVSAEGLVSLRNLIIEKDAGALDETNKRNLQRHLHKLAKAAQLSLAKGALQQNHIQFLLTVNNEAKVRRSTKSLVLGKAKVMGYEELVEAREKRVEKEAAQKAKGKGKRGRKRTSAAVEDDTAEPKTKAKRVTEEPQPSITLATTSTVAAVVGIETAPAPWRAPVARIEEIPPYAILSHTWGEQEVVFDDLKSLASVKDIDAKRGTGWNKIRFCAQQAERDGLKHFWVDSCCIDKTNSQELQEAINSMFGWYQNAKKCYVYLSDVECNTPNPDSESSRRWKPAFRKSRWFTRGWTLQELLAPASVAFYSKEEDLLGDKQSLKDTIHEITGIPIEALQGSPLSDFSVAERFSWTKDRETTREEDSAYCLLGIFSICMTLRYTEGKDRAIKRLRQKVQRPMKDIEVRLGKICSWLSAPDPSTNYHKAHKQRQAKTGLWLLESAKFAEWKERATSRLWLYGIPGCGKTILSSTIIEHLLQHCHDDTSIVTAYFYFDFNDTQKQDPELMLRSLLCQFLQRSVVIPKGVDALFLSCENGKRQPSLHALLEVTREAAQEFAHVYVVLDALDECTQRSELMDMLDTVAGWQLNKLHLLMTSRKERDIETSLESYVREEDAVCLQRD